MAVASAGPYASLHLTPDRQPRQHPTTQFFTGRMPFLPPNQQRQSTGGKPVHNSNQEIKEAFNGLFLRTYPADPVRKVNQSGFH